LKKPLNAAFFSKIFGFWLISLNLKPLQQQTKGKVKKLGYTELQSAEMPDNFVD
jgi:hypothetical protein